MTLYVVLLSLASVFLHILIRILVPDLPKVNNEPVNSDHLPSGSRPLTLCVFAVSDTYKNTPANEKMKKEKEKNSPYNNNNNNVYLSYAHQRPERSHDTY